MLDIYKIIILLSILLLAGFIVWFFLRKYLANEGNKVESISFAELEKWLNNEFDKFCAKEYFYQLYKKSLSQPLSKSEQNFMEEAQHKVYAIPTLIIEQQNRPQEYSFKDYTDFMKKYIVQHTGNTPDEYDDLDYLVEQILRKKVQAEMAMKTERMDG